MIKRSLALTLFFLPGLSGLLPGQTHPLSVDDLLAMERLSDPQVSPDVRSVVFTVRSTDFAGNRGRHDLWLAAIDGSQVRRLTTHDANDTSPRWLPDGRSIAFLSSRSGSSQVWRLYVDGGEPEQLTSFLLDVDNLIVFPDGLRLLLTMEVYPDVPSLEDTVRRDDERANSKIQARVYDHLLVRHWDAWEDGKQSHVFVWSIGGGVPLDLMKGMYADAPTKPFGGAEELAISPDGTEIVFAAKDEGSANAWSTNVDLWSVPSDGSAPARRITAENPAWDNSPAFSPDGRWLAWLSMARPQYESDRTRIAVLDRRTGDRRILTEEWDRSPSEIVWSADSRRVYTTADHIGNKALFTVDATTGAAIVLVERGNCASPRPAGSRLLFAHDSFVSPVELFTIALDGTGLAPTTAFNKKTLGTTRMGDYEQFSFPGARGDTVYGYLVYPADFDASRKFPVAFLIHGGPQGSFSNHFHYRWNPQVFSGAGYAAVLIDFHGSTGYGQAFTDSIRGDWGGAPFEDLMKGLDFALDRYPFLDGKRVGALGASFGGFMVNWIAGQTDRFRCLVNHDGNLDERMAFFDTEELWFPEWDHGGTPWSNPEGYARHNPIDHVERWKTPMLVVHGGLDYRVVDTQGLSTFTALQRRGIPSKLLHFPDENHWVLKPENSKLWHKTVLAWLDQWLK